MDRGTFPERQKRHNLVLRIGRNLTRVSGRTVFSLMCSRDPSLAKTQNTHTFTA